MKTSSLTVGQLYLVSGEGDGPGHIGPLRGGAAAAVKVAKCNGDRWAYVAEARDTDTGATLVRIGS